MKNLLKFLSLIFIVLSVASCTKKKDWTCTCVHVIEGEISTSVITDASEEEARKECNEKDFTWQVLRVDCELVE